MKLAGTLHMLISYCELNLGLNNADHDFVELK